MHKCYVYYAATRSRLKHTSLMMICIRKKCTPLWNALWSSAYEMGAIKVRLMSYSMIKLNKVLYVLMMRYSNRWQTDLNLKCISLGMSQFDALSGKLWRIPYWQVFFVLLLMCIKIKYVMCWVILFEERNSEFLRNNKSDGSLCGRERRVFVLKRKSVFERLLKNSSHL